MKIGAVYPQTELRGDPEALDRIGRELEAMGYDHLVMYDHVVGAARVLRDPPLWEDGPYTDAHPFHDPMVAFGYLAGVTTRLEFVTGILILPQRQTVLVAKQATDVALLSRGRFTLGVGTGWNHVEYDALGENFATRGTRLDEQIELLRQLWTQPLLDFEGRFHRVDRAAINPRPRQSIPILCGGFSEPAFRRAARMADGFIFASDLAAATFGWARVQELLRQTERPARRFRAQCLVMDDKARALPRQEALDVLGRWEDLGGTHASILSMGLGLGTTDAHLDHFAEMMARL